MTEEVSVTPSSRGWDVTLNVDGDDVSGLAVIDKKNRIGKAHLKMAGVAGVWTDEAHRKKGYASRVMWASIEEMARRRYDVSILFGIEDFYHRYGYAVCCANSVCQVETDVLPRSSTGFRVRAAKASDLPRIVSIYEKTNADRPVSAVRSRTWQPVHGSLPGWRMPRMGADVERRPGKAIVGEDAKGRLIGYASYDAQDGHCMVTEVGAADRSVYPALAHRLRRLASGVGADRVRFCLPVDDPFGQYLGRFGCGWSIQFSENSGSMGRLVSVSSTFQKLLPTLGERLGRSGLVLPQGGLTFLVGEEAVTLDCRKNGLVLTEVRSKSVVRVGQMPSMQLLCGYRSVDDLMIADEIQIAGAQVPVVSALFPRSHPYVGWGDRFWEKRMSYTVGLLSPGDMGSAVGKRMADHGVDVITCLAGRSDRTKALAEASGIGVVASLEDLVTSCDIVISIMVPSEALGAAESVAGAIGKVKKALPYADCNAIAPSTAKRIGEAIAGAGGKPIDAGIIGGPPRGGPLRGEHSRGGPSQGESPSTRFYASGKDAELFARLNDFGLDVRVIGDEIGQASGLKMCYAASTKGSSALMLELLIAAKRLGLYDSLIAEFGLSQETRLKSLGGLIGVPPKSRRWIGEMEEIAKTFEEVGLTPDMFTGAAEMFRLAGASDLADETPENRDKNRTLDALIENLAK